MLQGIAQRETVEGLLSLLHSLSINTGISETSEEGNPEDTAEQHNEAGPATKQDVLTQLISVLPLVFSCATADTQVSYSFTKENLTICIIILSIGCDDHEQLLCLIS